MLEISWKSPKADTMLLYSINLRDKETCCMHLRCLYKIIKSCLRKGLSWKTIVVNQVIDQLIFWYGSQYNAQAPK